MSSAAAPTVIIFDLDATLIGDVVWLAMERGLIQQYNHASKHKVRYNLATLKNDLKQGLIRPYVGDALRAIQKAYVHAEFFIYTASDTKWAEFLVPQIESLIGVHFNRPLFTRKHCINKQGVFFKSLDMIKVPLVKHLSKKYPQVTSLQTIPFLIMVDNMEHSLMERAYQVTCPSYNFKLPVDLLRHFPLTHVPLFAPHIKSLIGMKEQRSIQNRVHFMLYYHKFMHNLYYKAHKNNRAYVNDMFWKRFAKVFISMHPSLHNKPVETCKYLNQKLNEREQHPK